MKLILAIMIGAVAFGTGINFISVNAEEIQATSTYKEPSFFDEIAYKFEDTEGYQVRYTFEQVSHLRELGLEKEEIVQLQQDGQNYDQVLVKLGISSLLEEGKEQAGSFIEGLIKKHN
ncbi:hypothetical protein AN639_12505 [Candidatus Epulonipiscium fishelsonii]|uniref:Uncharacterized protein n=1 Tax=Candidatus Epulonipiscium fishelsonii TaxID=77094 RepID=A0ACC8XC74_9FIRM|nr:hypothetical protein AN396_01275 [Epulopiscium sp. SCG-B11WGA-EpuloA1]ONI42474.1 hypothetical protein AN639_12505 [Epulopiscium sp. SCG-B05WGA-EpuloA1]ONI47123.1 hypothetical protein AN644_01525 [Epulopiscium sp. SCG-C06WGA-EpuloA1]